MYWLFCCYRCIVGFVFNILIIGNVKYVYHFDQLMDIMDIVPDVWFNGQSRKELELRQAFHCRVTFSCPPGPFWADWEQVCFMHTEGD